MVEATSSLAGECSGCFLFTLACTAPGISTHSNFSATLKTPARRHVTLLGCLLGLRSSTNSFEAHRTLPGGPQAAPAPQHAKLWSWLSPAFAKRVWYSVLLCSLSQKKRCSACSLWGWWCKQPTRVATEQLCRHGRTAASAKCGRRPGSFPTPRVAIPRSG